MQHTQKRTSVWIGDIPDYEELMHRNVSLAVALLQEFQACIDKNCLAAGGRLVENYFGTGQQFIFNSTVQAKQFALALYKELQEHEHLTKILLIVGNKQEVDDTAIEVLLTHTKTGVYLVNDQTHELTDLYGSDWQGATIENRGSTWDKVISGKRRGKISQLQLPVYIVLFLVIAGIVLAGWQLFGSKDSLHSNQAERAKNSIAVLPFSNLGSDTSLYFTDGVMEDILTNLSKLPEIKVISRTSSMQYRNTEKSIKEIANELGVNYILEGSVRQFADKVKITAQLIDALNDHHVWANNYERNLDDIFEIQSDVSRKIAVSLNKNLSSRNALEFKQPTDQFASYNILLKAKSLISIRTKKSLESSLGLLNLALHKDPDYADVRANKAYVLMLMTNFNYLPAIKGANQAEQNALIALQLDPKNDLAYAILAQIYQDKQEWDQALSYYEDALRVNPNSAITNYWYSLLLRQLERYDEAIQYGSIAVELDPLYPVIQCGHALTCIMGNRPQIAKSILLDGELLFNDFFSYHWVYGYYYLTIEEYNQAHQAFVKSLELNPEFRPIKRSLIYTKGRLGLEDEVNDYIASISGKTAADYLGLANAFAGLEMWPECLANLEQLHEMGSLEPNIRNSVKFKDLAGNPQFENLIQKARKSQNLPIL